MHSCLGGGTEWSWLWQHYRNCHDSVSYFSWQQSHHVLSNTLLMWRQVQCASLMLGWALKILGQRWLQTSRGSQTKSSMNWDHVSQQTAAEFRAKQKRVSKLSKAVLILSRFLPEQVPGALLFCVLVTVCWDPVNHRLTNNKVIQIWLPGTDKTCIGYINWKCLHKH